MKPHLLKEVRNGTEDTAAVRYAAETVDTPEVDAGHLKIMREALGGVAAGSTSLQAAFAAQGLDVADVACKTGTGEVAGKEDYAWFVCYMPADDPKYVVSVMIEQGGGGAATAGPIGAKVMAAALAADAGELTEVGAVVASSGESVEYMGESSGRTD